MKAFLYTILIICSLISLAMQVPTVRSACSAYIESYLIEKTGKKVYIGAISTIFPFIFWTNECEVQDVKIKSLLIIPSLPELFIGRLAFFRVSAESISTEQIKGRQEMKPFTSYLPEIKLSLHSFKCKKVAIENNTQLSIQGSFYWNPEKKRIKCHSNITFLHQTPAVAYNFQLETTPHEIKGHIDAHLSELFITSSFKEATLHLDVHSRHTISLLPIWGTSAQADGKEILRFTYDLSCAENAAPDSSNRRRLWHANGAAILHTDKHIDFTNKRFDCTTYHPVLSERSDQPGKQTQLIKIAKEVLLGTISGSIQSDTRGYKLFIDSESLEYNNIILKKLSAYVKIAAEQNGYEGGMELSCLIDRKLRPPGSNDRSLHYLNEVPLTICASGTSDGATTLNVPNLIIKSADSQAHGNLQFFFFPFLIKGGLTGEISSLAPFSKLALTDLNGKGRFFCRFNPLLKKASDYSIEQSLQSSFTWKNLEFDDFSCKSAQLSINTHGLFPTPHVAILLEMEQFRGKRLELREARFCANCDLEQKILNIPFELQTQSVSKKDAKKARPQNFGASGVLRMSAPWMHETKKYFSIQEAVLHLNNSYVSLSNPLEISYDQDEVAITPFTFITNNDPTKIVFSGSGSVVKQIANIHLTFTHCPITPLELFIPDFPFQGSCYGSLELFGRITKPKMHVELVTQNLTLRPDLQTGNESIPVSINFEAEISSGVCNTQCSIRSFHDETDTVDLELTLPCIFTLAQPKFAISEEASIAGTLSGEGNLSSLSWLLNENQRFIGDARMNLKLFGSLKQPKCSGILELRNATITIPDTGCILHDVFLKAQASQDKIIIEKFSGSDEDEGSFSGSGVVYLHPQEGFPFSFDLHVNKMQLLQKNLIKATTTGKGVLHRDKQGLHLQAALTLDKGIVNLNAQPAKEIAVADFIYTYHGEPVEQEAKQKKPFYFNLDLTINQNPIEIVGMGLKTSWTGHLLIKGVPDALEFYGNMNHAKGVYSLAGKACHITRGEIVWDGPILTHSKLNVQAACPTTDIASYITLKGSLENPLLNVRSIPPLPQKEILSRIVFNKPLSEISSIEALQLAQLLLSVRSQKKNTSIIHKMKKGLGIDTIDITHKSNPQQQKDDSNSVSIQVGKYLSQGVLVKLSKDVMNEANRIGIEAKLLKNVSVQAEFGDDAAGEVRLRWKMDW